MESDPPDRSFWDIPDDLPSGAWAEKRKLAAELRRLTELCVTTDAPEEALSGARALVERLAAELGEHPQRTYKQAYPSCKTSEDRSRFADRNPVIGQCNPTAPFMSIGAEGDSVFGLVNFGPAYEGAPGCVHGGLVAAAFDQLFGYLQTRRRVASMTGSLTVRYRRPTPIEVDLRLEASVTRASGRRHFIEGRMTARGELIADAEAVFIEIESSKLRAMFESLRRGED